MRRVVEKQGAVVGKAVVTADVASGTELWLIGAHIAIEQAERARCPCGDRQGSSSRHRARSQHGALPSAHRHRGGRDLARRLRYRGQEVRYPGQDAARAAADASALDLGDAARGIQRRLQDQQLASRHQGAFRPPRRRASPEDRIRAARPAPGGAKRARSTRHVHDRSCRRSRRPHEGRLQDLPHYRTTRLSIARQPDQRVRLCDGSSGSLTLTLRASLRAEARRTTAPVQHRGTWGTRRVSYGFRTGSSSRWAAPSSPGSTPLTVLTAADDRQPSAVA
jgi:hypothetical protein